MILLYFVSTRGFSYFWWFSMAEKPTEGGAVFSALLQGPHSRLLNARTTGLPCCAGYASPLGSWGTGNDLCPLNATATEEKKSQMTQELLGAGDQELTLVPAACPSSSKYLFLQDAL